MHAILFTFFAFAVTALATVEQDPKKLNLTAISASNGESTLECWQLDAPFKSSSDAGTIGSINLILGNISTASMTVLPPRYDGGFHHAPTHQYVLFTSGYVHVSLWNSQDEAWIQGGKYGLIIAADVDGESTHGHRTRYPSGSETTAIQLPIKDFENVGHKVLHSGPCKDAELSGL